MSDDSPTLRLPTMNAAPPPPPTLPPIRPSRAQMIAFFVVCGLVVAAVCVLTVVLVNRGNTASQGPITAPTASQAAPAPAQAPQPPGAFTTFEVPATQQCDGHGKQRQSADVQVTWATTQATQVWLVQGTGDAVSAGLEQIPLSGNQDSLPLPLQLDCSSPSTTFTLTLVGNDGGHVSRSWTVTPSGGD